MTSAEAFAEISCPPDAGEMEIKSRYRARLMLCHPDRGGSTDALMRVTEAWRVLQAGAEDRVRCQVCKGSGSTVAYAGFTSVKVVCAGCDGSGKKKELL